MNLILDLIFPPVCIICGKHNKCYICDKCYEEILKLECNKIDVYDDSIFFFDKHMFIFKYDGVIRDKIIDFKFNDKAFLYNFFCEIIINNKKVCDFINSYDIIIPVPIHRKRRIDRGYNQCELIAKKVIKILKENGNQNTDINCKALRKIRNTVKQSTLDKHSRMKNVEGAYEINIDEISGIIKKNVLIFDDIYTTGSTAKECAKVLQEAGCNSVAILTIAKD